MAVGAFILQDETGTVLACQPDVSDPTHRGHSLSEVAESQGSEGIQLDSMSAGQIYNDLVAPLFTLPAKLPETAWHGHIPFLMMLIKSMRPERYVELGTHFGASLIAAATASKTYSVPMKICGIDSWEGDGHAGYYEGEAIFKNLQAYIDENFSNVELMRCFFDDANPRFDPGNIDILLIDGLHTYEAVKHDFLTWLPKMAPDGVIMLHDTCVFERGFGVHQFWDELKDRYTSISFGHCHGLGVVLLDPSSPRVAALGQVAESTELSRFYVSLVSQIGGLVPQRMMHLDMERHGRASEQQLQNELAAVRCQLDKLQGAGKILDLQRRDFEIERDSYKMQINEMSAELKFYKQQLQIASQKAYP